MTTIFSKIIAREIPSQFLYEDDVCVAIMDKYPSVNGQALIIPKIETDYIFDLPEEIYNHLFEVAKKVALALDSAFDTERTCLVVEGFEVPHVHIKLFPITETTKSLSSIMSHQTEKTDEELDVDAEKIKMNIKKSKRDH